MFWGSIGIKTACVFNAYSNVVHRFIMHYNAALHPSWVVIERFFWRERANFPRQSSVQFRVAFPLFCNISMITGLLISLLLPSFTLEMWKCVYANFRGGLYKTGIRLLVILEGMIHGQYECCWIYGNWEGVVSDNMILWGFVWNDQWGFCRDRVRNWCWLWN